MPRFPQPEFYLPEPPGTSLVLLKARSRLSSRLKGPIAVECILLLGWSDEHFNRDAWLHRQSHSDGDDEILVKAIAKNL